MKLRHSKPALNFALAAVYSAAGTFGLSLAHIDPNASAVWPPSGIALAAVLLWGYSLWPGILVGAFLVNFMAQGSAVTALGIASGNTLEALVAAALVQQFAEGRKAFDRTPSLVRFIILAGLLSTALGATIGVTTLTLGGFVQQDNFAGIWLTWWLGDAVGILIIAPLLLMWLGQPAPLPIRFRQVLEAAGLLAALLVISTLLFLSRVPPGLEYFALVPLLWGALRYGRRGAITAAFIVSAIALWGTVLDLGPFASSDPHQSLLLVQLFMATITVTALIVAAVTSQQRRLEQRLRIKDAVSRTLSEATAVHDATQKIIQTICQTAGWDLGAFWLVRRDERKLACADLWSLPPLKTTEFIRVTQQIQFAPGVGLLGRVWSTGKTHWIADVVNDDNFPRAPVAAKAGLHGAVAFPVKLDNEVFGILEFFSQEIRQADDDFQEMIASIGAQLGQFIERQHAETALRQSESRLQVALSAGQMGAWEWDMAAQKVTWSPSLEAIHGLQPGSFGGTYEDFKRDIHADDLPAVLAEVERAVETRGDYHVVYRIVPPDGRVRWVEAFGRHSSEETGEPQRMAGVCMDITEKKQREEMLQQRTHSLEIINRVGNALSAELDLPKIVQIVTDAGRDISGAQFGAFFYNVKNDAGESFSLYTLSGAPPEAFNKFPMPRNTPLFGPTFRGEGVLRIGDVLNDPRYGKNPPHHGMPAGHLLVRSYLAVPVLSRSGEALGGLFYGHPEPDVFTAEAESIITAIAAQAAVAFDNASLYQTAQRRAEEFQKLIDTAPVGIAVATDAECKNIWGNPEFQRMLGMAAPENLSKTSRRDDELPFKVLRGGLEVAAEDLPMQRAARDSIEVLDEELEIVWRDGTVVHEICRATPLKDELGRVRGCIGVFLNITERKQADAALQQARDDLARANEGLERRIQERTAELQMANAALFAEREEEKRLEQQLRQAQKMESIGTLASGIAHDFNNILNIIKGYASLLHSAGSTRDSAEAFQVIDETIERGAATVRQLLALARESRLDFEPIDLNDILEKLKGLLAGTFPKTLDIAVELDQRTPSVMADPNQLHQVLLNICLNARDAMPGGGRLLLTSAIVSGAELRRSFQQVRDQDYACVIISDTGAGMDETVKQRIFEPFFTTKSPGQGSGLGLAVAYGIVDRHGGFIDVHSEPGQGSSFRIYLPLAAGYSASGEATLAVARPKRVANAPAGGQLVLFVDDEKRQLRLMRSYLETRGFRVLTAADGVEAVEVFLAHKEEIAAVVLDVGLPKLNGWDALQKMKAADPGVKPILASGYISPEIESALADGQLSAVILKPYKLTEIADAIASAAGSVGERGTVS